MACDNGVDVVNLEEFGKEVSNTSLERWKRGVNGKANNDNSQAELSALLTVSPISMLGKPRAIANVTLKIK